MRIIHIITGLGQGGAEAMLEKLITTGRRLNPEIEQQALSLSGSGRVGERLTRAGVPVECLDLGPSPRALRALLRLVRTLAPAPQPIVQTWLWHADLVGGLCARAAGNRRLVWNLRNSMPTHPATKWSSRLIARLCARLSRRLPLAIICNSEAALRAHTAIGYPAAKCTVIPNGFDLRAAREAHAARGRLRALWDIAPEQLFIGMVARVDPLKDHASFIRAAQQLQARDARLRFLLLGEGVTRDAGIRVLLQQGDARAFRLAEGGASIPEVMSALDIFCLASHSEGFPNVIGEAMAAALPTVASDVGDIRALLTDSRLLAPPGDAQQLAACLQYVAQLGEAERRALGEHLRRRVEAEFDIERIWARYREFYESLESLGCALERVR